MEMANVRVLLSWLMAIIIALVMITTGIPMLRGDEQAETDFMRWGYDSGFATLIGILQIIAGILVVIPSLSMIGAALVICIMTGAIYTHVSTSIGSPGFAVIILLLAIALLLLRRNQVIFLSRERKKQTEAR